MPYKTTWEESGIYREYSGIVCPEDVKNSNNEFYRDLRVKTALYQIIDFSNIHKLDANNEAIKQAIVMDHGQYLATSNIKVACVIRRSEIILSIAEYIKILIKFQPNWSFRVFEDVSSAREWATKT